MAKDKKTEAPVPKKTIIREEAPAGSAGKKEIREITKKAGSQVEEKLKAAPDEVIAKRLSGRRVCKNCGNSYHIEYKKPSAEGICDACGGELIQRSDDAPETILERLAVYHEKTEPLKAYYEKQGKLFIVEGQEDVADTTALTLRLLEEKA